jgi:hypothetical protein
MLQITFQNVYQTSTTKQFRLGTRAVTPDGSEWVYVKADTALAKGSVAVPNAVASADTVSSSTDSQGRIVFITEASAGWTPGLFADGWVVVDDGTGVGQAGKIKDNTADTIELYPEYAFGTALSVSDSDITIWTQYLVDKAAVTTEVQNATGIAQVAFAAADYGFLLTRGIGVVLAGEALVVGKSFTPGDDTTGQVIKGTTAKGDFDEESLGVCIVANAAADQLTLVYAKIS